MVQHPFLLSYMIFVRFVVYLIFFNSLTLTPIQMNPDTSSQNQVDSHDFSRFLLLHSFGMLILKRYMLRRVRTNPFRAGAARP